MSMRTFMQALSQPARAAWALLAALLWTAQALARPVEVLHNLEAGPDREAALVLQAALRERGYVWKDFAIAGGGSGLAAAILKSRVRLGNPPPVAQMKARAIREWAARGALLPLDDIARAGQWDGVLPAVVAEAMKHEGRYVGVPLNIHRVNWLWINARVLKASGAQLPSTWDEFFAAADAMQRAGYTAVEVNGQPWELLLMFESVVLGVGGPQFYRSALLERDPAALAGPTMELALRTFRRIKPYTRAGQSGRREPGGGDAFLQGKSGMLLNGDWVAPRLRGRSRRGPDYLCVPAPGSAGSFSFAIDAFAMFKTRTPDGPAQQAFASMVMTPAVQRDFNLRKGSLPANKGVPLNDFTACARQSATAFQAAALSHSLVPALGTALAVEQEEALRQIVSEFWNDERIAPRQVMQRLLPASQQR
jgi:glucose/mannose transport system substrate-binding protein